MNFDIDGFRATLDKSNGINHGNIFDVMIAPGWLGNNKISKKFSALLGGMMLEGYGTWGSFTEVWKEMRFLCRAASIPSKDISTSDWSAYGPIGKFPYESSHGDLELEFMITNNKMLERKFFEAWLNIVEDSGTHTIGWLKDYISTINVHILSHGKHGYNSSTNTDLGGGRTRNTPGEHDNKRIGTVEIKDAYPVSLSEITLNHDNEGLQTFSVTLTYDQYAFKGNTASMMR